jgi:hypothetical protein
MEWAGNWELRALLIEQPPIVNWSGGGRKVIQSYYNQIIQCVTLAINLQPPPPPPPPHTHTRYSFWRCPCFKYVIHSSCKLTKDARHGFKVPSRCSRPRKSNVGFVKWLLYMNSVVCGVSVLFFPYLVFLLLLLFCSCAVSAIGYLAVDAEHLL